MLPVEFEPAIQASERPQTQALDCAAIGIDTLNKYDISGMAVITR